MQDRRTLLKELFRKSIHLCSAFVPLFLKYQYWLTIIVLFILVILYSICEFFRLRGMKIPFITSFTNLAARQRDENKFILGPVTLVFGILIAALLLPLNAATVGIYALAFGDGLASLVGKTFGKIKIPLTGGKTIAGSLACFTAVFISTYCVCKKLSLSLIVAAFSTVIEVLPLLDFDNLIIPVLVGTVYLIFL